MNTIYSFNRGDKVKIIGKSQGRSLAEVVKSRKLALKSDKWDHIGWVRDIEGSTVIVVYSSTHISGGDYYTIDDLILECEIEKELFEL